MKSLPFYNISNLRLNKKSHRVQFLPVSPLCGKALIVHLLCYKRKSPKLWMWLWMRLTVLIYVPASC